MPNHAYDPEPYDLDIAQSVLDGIANGERVHAACSKAGTSWRTFWHWKSLSPELSARYAHARAASAAYWQDKATETVEACPPDRDEVARARLREDHYRWRAKVANPQELGDGAGPAVTTVSVGAVFVLPPLNAPPTPPDALGADGPVIVLPDPTGREAGRAVARLVATTGERGG